MVWLTLPVQLAAELGIFVYFTSSDKVFFHIVCAWMRKIADCGNIFGGMPVYWGQIS